MSIGSSLLPEFDHEMATNRRLSSTRSTFVTAAVLLVATLLMPGSSAGLVADQSTQPRAQDDVQRLTALALERLALSKEGARPYLLRAKFKLTESGRSLEGVFETKWVDRTRFHTSIVTPGFRFLHSRQADKQWYSFRPETPPGLLMLIASFLSGPGAIPAKEKAELKGERIVEGATNLIVSISSKASLQIGASNQYLFIDPQRGFLTASSRLIRKGDTRVVEYLDYQSFRDSYFPRKIVASDNFQPFLEVEVTELAEWRADEDLPAAPRELQPWPSCANMIPPKPLRTPDPDYPLNARDEPNTGMVVLQVPIDEQGRVFAPVVYESLGKNFDKEALAAVKRWRFQPAKCGQAPVRTVIRVEVNFNLVP
jgi:TonB family protein